MSDVIYENGAFTFYFEGEAMSSRPTFKKAKQDERRFLNILARGKQKNA